MDDLARLALAATAGGGLASLAQLGGYTAETLRAPTAERQALARPPAMSLMRRPSTAARRQGATKAAPSVARTFDAVFARHGRGLPVSFLRALAWHESRLQARAHNRVATGLLQVIDVVRADHNRLHGTAYTRDDLNDPIVNVTIAAGALRRIVGSYARNHAAIPNLREDWNNYRFVELLVFGWNAGWSERAGVGRVARYLEELGTRDITIELVHQHARAAGASEHLQNASKLQWCKQVAQLYAEQRARDNTEIEMPPMEFFASPPLVAFADDAAPVSSPSQVDPTPIAAAPPITATASTHESSMVPIDPYAATASTHESSMVPIDPYAG